MNRSLHIPIPAVRALKKLGQGINDAKRRRITINLLFERTALSRTTVLKIENGDPTVSMGRYASCATKTNEKGHTEVVKLLLDAGADPAIKDKDGYIARYFSRKKDIDQLLKNAQKKIDLIRSSTTYDIDSIQKARYYCS